MSRNLRLFAAAAVVVFVGLCCAEQQPQPGSCAANGNVGEGCSADAFETLSSPIVFVNGDGNPNGDLGFRLNTGAFIPSVGLGTWQAPPGEVGAAVLEAIRLGYRHIDCAPVYQNEPEIGAAIAQAIDEGVVTRDQLFITSKLSNFKHAPEGVEAALHQTLHDLQLEYVDLYLMHWPVSLVKRENQSLPFVDGDFSAVPLIDTYRAMEALVPSGKVKAIGVSNFSAKKLKDLIAMAKIVPAVNQVELHPMLQQHKLKATCDQLGVHLSAYAPLGSPQRPARTRSETDQHVTVLDHPTIAQAAALTGTPSKAYVCLRWGVQRGTSVLPKSTNSQRLAENLSVMKMPPLTTDVVALIESMAASEQNRLFKGGMFVGSQRDNMNPTLESLWDGEDI